MINANASFIKTEAEQEINGFYETHNPFSSYLFNVGVCVSLFVLYTQHQNMHSVSKVTTILGSEDILADPHNFKGVF